MSTLDVKYVTFEGASGLDRFSGPTLEAALAKLLDWMAAKRLEKKPVLLVQIAKC